MRSIDLLDRPIAFHRCLAELAGSVNAGLMLSQALYWAKRTRDDSGWFYKTRDEWQEETYLKRTEQETARKALRALGCWHEELRGVPAKLYYRVDFDHLEELLTADKQVEIPPASKQESSLPVGRIPASKKVEKLPTFITETTTEITSKTTAESVVRSPGAIPARPHTPQTDQDAVSIALSVFPSLGIYQQEVIGNADINHTHLWRKALEDWRDNRYSLRNITGLIDSYYRLEKMDNREKEFRNNGRQAIRESHNERAARESFELIAKLTGQESSDNSPDPTDSIFKLPAAFGG